MGGGGGGKGGMSQSKTLEKNNATLFRESTPLRRETLDQTLEALRTGGVGAQIPLIQRSVESSRAATSGALKGLEGDIAKSPGLGGTPFAERLRTQTRLGGDQATSQIPSQMASQMAQGANALALGFPQISNQGLASSGQLSSAAKGQQLGFASDIFGSTAGMFKFGRPQ